MMTLDSLAVTLKMLRECEAEEAAARKLLTQLAQRRAALMLDVDRYVTRALAVEEANAHATR